MSENPFEKKNIATGADKSLISQKTNNETGTAFTDIAHINVNNIAGPLVVFFGPRNIGKTVALLRLCNYLSKYDITVDEGFRSDINDYRATIEAFNRLRVDSSFAPAATGVINFLLLNVAHNGTRQCQILEAPGEHFFDRDQPEQLFPHYLNEIFNRDYRKVYVFFFSINMFPTDNDRKKYANRISKFINSRVEPKRDKVIIVCTKCNEEPKYFRGNRPVKENYRNDLYSKPGFEAVSDTIKNSGFKKAPFVPFSSGDFNQDSTGQQRFTMSQDFYPEDLWNHIHEAITGKTSWFQKIFG